MPDKKNPSALKSLVKAETALQIALVLPAAVFIGWALGGALDHWLHTHWLFLGGIILGAIAGFIQMFRMANQLMRSPD